MSAEGKSLLRQLEDENSLLSRERGPLLDEIRTLRSTVALQEKKLLQLSAAIPPKEEAAACANHQLLLARASLEGMQRTNAALQEELRVVRREGEVRAKECARLSSRAVKAEEEASAARVAAEELQTALNAREAAVNFEAARGCALESGVDALLERLRAKEAATEARVGEWLQERRRIRDELRKASEVNAGLQKSYAAQVARSSKLKERLDVLAHSLRVCPPRNGKIEARSPELHSVGTERMDRAVGGTRGRETAAMSSCSVEQPLYPYQFLPSPLLSSQCHHAMLPSSLVCSFRAILPAL